MCVGERDRVGGGESVYVDGRGGARGGRECVWVRLLELEWDFCVCVEVEREREIDEIHPSNKIVK